MFPVFTTTPRHADMAAVRELYDDDGWLALPNIGEHEVAELRHAVDRLAETSRPEIVHEQGSDLVRAIHGSHAYDAACARLVRLPALVDLAEALLGESVYVYQFKINIKNPRKGAAWPWHQDYAFWAWEDGMPEPRAVNLAVLLDDTDADNGALQVIPGSHRLGLAPSGGDDVARRSHDWRDHVSADLAHQVPRETAEELARTMGVRSVEGRAGALYAFHPSIVHASSSNLSDRRRTMVLVTYNAVSNAPARLTRPDFLVSRDTTPVVSTESDPG